MQTVVQWKEKFKDEVGVEHTRTRKYDWDAEKREFIDFENGVATLRYPVEMLADKDEGEMQTIEAKRIVRFAKKEMNNG